jgi:hypothetical protein
MYPVVAFWSASAAPAHVVLYGLFPVPSFIGTINAVLLFGVTLWQWSILKRPDVKALFIQKKISGF